MDMFAAAMRMSSEVLGYLPQHELQEEVAVKYVALLSSWTDDINTLKPSRYDKARDLEFTLFLSTVPAAAKESFLPRIDEELYIKASWLPIKSIDDQLTYMHRAVQVAWKGESGQKY